MDKQTNISGKRISIDELLENTNKHFQERLIEDTCDLNEYTGDYRDFYIQRSTLYHFKAHQALESAKDMVSYGYFDYANGYKQQHVDYAELGDWYLRRVWGYKE